MRHRRVQRGRNQGGFALPLVLMFALTSTILIAMMIERVTVGRRAAARQIEGYRETHASKGVQELMDAWLRSIPGRNIQSMIPREGPALRLELADGTAADVTLTDGQSRLLSTGVASSSSDLSVILKGLERRVGPADVPGMLRSFGPKSVSVNTAPVEVLAAIIDAFTDDELGDRVASQLVELRRGQPIDQQDLDKIVLGYGVTPDQWQRMESWLTANPNVWRIEVTRTEPSRTPGVPGATDTFAGYAVLGQGRGPGAGFDASSIWSSRTAIREWRRQVAPTPQEPTSR